MHNLSENKNKGVSLVELVVVISIMAILTGLTSLGISVMFSRDAQSAAITIDDALSKTRMMSMSQPGEYTMKIYCNKDGNYEGNDSDINYIKIFTGDESAPTSEEKIYFKTKAYIGKGVSSFPLASDSTIEIKFDKSNGSIKYVDGTLSSQDIIRINCCAVKNMTKTATIKLLPVSGKHYVE